MKLLNLLSKPKKISDIIPDYKEYTRLQKEDSVLLNQIINIGLKDKNVILNKTFPKQKKIPKFSTWPAEMASD